jgi:ERCC4-type nuclease
LVYVLGTGVLYLDARVGSGDLEPLLQRLGLTVEVIPRIDFADCAFFGHGPEGENSLSIGVEIKKLRDLLNVERLSGHQLPGLLRQYDHVWLIVEGLWRPGDDGVLEIPRGREWGPLELGRRRFMYREVSNYLTTLEVKAGVRVRRTYSREETARVVADLYGWWNDKAWDKHRSHLALHRGPDTAFLVPPPLRRRIAAELPGVGHDRSEAVAAAFGSTLEMINADVKTWLGVKGIGKTLASRITEAIGRE